jgi:hypothetical protein
VVRSSLAQLISSFASRVVGEKANAYDVMYDSFRTGCFLRSEASLPHNKNIAYHMKITSELYVREILMQRLLFFTLFASALYYLLFLLQSVTHFSRYMETPLDYFHIFLFLPCLTLILAFFLYLLIIKRNNKRPLSLLVASLVRLIVALHFMDTSSENFWKKASTKEDVQQQIDDILEKHERSHKKRHVTEIDKAKYHLELKKLVLKHMEMAATYLEDEIPRRLRSKDIITDDWFRRSMQQAAAALREKKKWILTPKEDSINHLINAITLTLTYIADGNWDALERREPEQISRPAYMHLFFSRLLSMLKTLFIGVFPIVGLTLIFQLTPITLPDTTRNIAFFAAFLWFGLTILINMDSQISTKLLLMKDVKSLM